MSWNKWDLLFVVHLSNDGIFSQDNRRKKYEGMDYIAA